MMVEQDSHPVMMVMAAVGAVAVAVTGLVGSSFSASLLF